MKNRRNYYRVLNVQPDAPLAVVKASYRTLMQKLRAHPDLGGDEKHARLLNEAYAVISDPLRRAEYDRLHGPDALRGCGNEAGSEPRQARSSPPNPADGGQTDTRLDPDTEHCPFCGALQAHQLERGGLPSVCVRCGSPQRQANEPISLHGGERRLGRIAREGAVEIYTHWPQARPYRAWLTDLSPTGIGLRSEVPLAPNSVIKVDGAEMQAIVRIRNCQSPPTLGTREYRCGGRFLTLSFDKERGNFVCTQA